VAAWFLQSKICKSFYSPGSPKENDPLRPICVKMSGGRAARAGQRVIAAQANGARF